MTTRRDSLGFCETHGGSFAPAGWCVECARDLEAARAAAGVVTAGGGVIDAEGGDESDGDSARRVPMAFAAVRLGGRWVGNERSRR